MTTYNECLTVILNDGRVIICQDNGYKIRTIDSGFGSSCLDSKRNNYGPVYWKKEALKKLGLSISAVAMQIKGDVSFRN